jgi:hypothetical protein
MGKNEGQSVFPTVWFALVVMPAVGIDFSKVKTLRETLENLREGILRVGALCEPTVNWIETRVSGLVVSFKDISHFLLLDVNLLCCFCSIVF